MKQTGRFKITVTILTIILIISIALFLKVYRANESIETTQSKTSQQTTSVKSTATQTQETTTTESSKPESTVTETTVTETSETTVVETTTETTVETSETSVIKNPTVVEARTMYLASYAAGSSSILDEIIEYSKTHELNAVVIDVKEGGMLLYDSQLPIVRDNGLYSVSYDPKWAVDKLHEAGIYVIARLVCFKDNKYAKTFPDRSIKKPDGTVASSDESAWANPYLEVNWDYNISIAKEVANLGFDEIQFDYVRFPSASSKSVDYGEVDIPAYSRAIAIAAFLEKAYGELKPLGVNISADVFAIACISDLDAKIIGQRVDWVSKYVDYICPMIYPSHYANSSTGIMGNGVGQGINGVHFTHPDLHPYEVVYNTLEAMKKMLVGKEDIIAIVRPYIQGFTSSYLRNGYYQTYGAEQVRQQVQGIYDAGFSEWIIWSSGNGQIMEGAFLGN